MFESDVIGTEKPIEVDDRISPVVICLMNKNLREFGIIDEQN